MLLKILQLIFCVTPLVLSLILYKKPYRFMAKFHASMKQNIRARKLYTRVILFLLLLFHYVYASGHAGEFGINRYLCRYVLVQAGGQVSEPFA